MNKMAYRRVIRVVMHHMMEFAKEYPESRIEFLLNDTDRRIFQWLENEFSDKYQACIEHYLLKQYKNCFVFSPDRPKLMSINLNQWLDKRYLESDVPRCKSITVYREMYADFDQFNFNETQNAMDWMLQNVKVAKDDQGTCMISFVAVQQNIPAFHFLQFMHNVISSPQGVDYRKSKFDLGPLQGIMVCDTHSWGGVATYRCSVDAWDFENTHKLENINAYMERKVPESQLERMTIPFTGKLQLSMYSPQLDPHKGKTNVTQ